MFRSVKLAGRVLQNVCATPHDNTSYTQQRIASSEWCQLVPFRGFGLGTDLVLIIVTH